jgi:predicted ATP-grasp superfamily ATP-dependent carboligase
MTRDGINILLTDGSFKHTLGIVRSLGNKYSVYVLSFRKHSLTSFSGFCKGEIIVKDYSDPGFAEEIQSVLNSYKISIVIPVGSRSVKTFSDHREIIEKSSKILLPESDSLEIALSKIKSTSLASQLEIPCPETITIKDLGDLEKIKHEILYPCVIKAPVEMGNNLVEYAKSPDDLLRQYQKLCKRYNSTGNFPVIQEYLKGTGCGFFALYHKGVCGPVFMHMRIREFPPSGGYSTAAISVDNELIEKYGRRILDHLKWNGVAMVEFKMADDGVPYFLEINPKFWGSTELAISSGVDFPQHLVNAILDNEIKYSRNYIVGRKFHWPFNGDISHGLLKPRNLPGVVRDCFDTKVKSNILFFSDTRASLMIIFMGFVNRLIYVFKYLGFGKR